MYSVLLEVLISLAGIYLLFSLFCSAVWEAWTQMRGSRGHLLRRRVSEILGGGALFEQVYRHPLLTALGTAAEKKRGPLAQSLFNVAFGHLQRPGAGTAGTDEKKHINPSYLPSRLFALAILSVASGARPTAEPAGFRATREGIVANPLLPPDTKERLLALMDAADHDLEQARRNIAAWFDSAMDRLSGTYQRQTQWGLFVIGLLVAAWANLDTFAMARAVWHNATLRQSIVSATDQMLQRLDTLHAMEAAKPAAKGDGKGDKPTPEKSEATGGKPAPEKSGGKGEKPVTEKGGDKADKAAEKGGEKNGPDTSTVRVGACAWALDRRKCETDGAPKYFGDDLNRQLTEWVKLGLPVGWDAECRRIQRTPAETQKSEPGEDKQQGATASDSGKEKQKDAKGPGNAKGTTPAPESCKMPEISTQNRGFWGWKLVGILLTAFFASFGSPFWFDLLNKLYGLRGAGAKPVK
jgi:hypothetical protein